MEHIFTESSGAVRVVTMARGKANALNGAMIEELLAALDAASADDSVRAVVLASGRPRFFSSGFDVGEVFAYDRDAMRRFFGRFTTLYESIASLPKPVVAAVSGYAFAGGAVLAVACDFRVMAEGPLGFALNEVNLGTLLPDGIIRLVLNACGPGHARSIVLAGETLSPARAFEIGLAHQLAAPEEVRDCAIRLAADLAAKAPLAFGQVKLRLRELGGHGSAAAQDIERFLESWFSEEAGARRRALTASMNK